MKQLIEVFVTIFLVTLSVLLFSQFIGSQLQINHAKDFHSNSIAQIEESDFDLNVIEECIRQAREQGYTLTVANTGTNKFQCKNCNIVFAGENAECPNCKNLEQVFYTKERTCNVTLKYTVELNLLNVKTEGSINGYAR